MINRKKEETNIMVEFCAFGDNFNPSVITDRLKLIPKCTWKKGDRIEDHNHFRKENCWTFGTGYENSLDVMEQLKIILDVLYPCKKKLLELKDELSVEYSLEVVINIEQAQTPALYFEKDIIEFCNDIGIIFIDVDLYVL